MRVPDDVLLKLIWNYMCVSTVILPADVIVVGGSNDAGTAAKASELYHLGFAPLILFSGYQQPGMEMTETDFLSDVAIKRGVPAAAIIREPLASNTGENIVLSQKILAEQGINAHKVILIHKPYMTRRFLATAQVQWPDPQPEFMLAHEEISIDNFYLKIGRGETIRSMLGDFKRMQSYAKKGFQTPQDIPAEVLDAFNELVERGHQIR